MDHESLLHSVRMFSILSCQRMFCNVSQVHEVFHALPSCLAELTALAKIDRFVAHSDYGSFDEFRESRLEKFAHSRAKHPAFFAKPSAELIRLPHSTMGKGISTTGHIETQLKGWIEDSESSLNTTLSQVDKKRLRHSEDWLERTLRLRDKKALTFDVRGGPRF